MLHIIGQIKCRADTSTANHSLAAHDICVDAAAAEKRLHRCSPARRSVLCASSVFRKQQLEHENELAGWIDRSRQRTVTPGSRLQSESKERRWSKLLLHLAHQRI